MSESTDTEPHETMQRENAFVAGEEAGQRRQREDENAELQQLRLQAEYGRKKAAEEAKAGQLTRAQAIAHGINVDDEEAFKPRVAPYLPTEHLFEQIDPPEYEHPDYGKVKGHIFGKCQLCGKTLAELAAAPAHLKPNMFLCMKSHERQQYLYGKQSTGGYKKAGAAAPGAKAAKTNYFKKN